MLNSLRFRLFAIILGPLLLIALGIGIWRLASAQQTAQEVFDRNLLVTALAVSRDVASRDGDAISVETAQLLSRSAGEPVRYHVYAPDGVFVTGFASPPVPIDFEWDRSQTFAYFDAVSRGRDVRVLRLQYVTQIAGFSGPFVVTVWQDNAQRQAFVQAQVLRALGVMAALLGATAVVVWFGVRLGLKPLLDLEDAISRRSPADLSPIRRRVPDEVQGLVTRINRLFGQVSASMEAQSAFISDAAHQLRNPIAGLRALGDSIRSARSLESAQERAADLVEAARGAGVLAESLMTLERARAASDLALASQVDVATLTQRLFDQMAAEQTRGVRMTARIAPGPVTMMADETMLREAVRNLVHNALVHGGPSLSEIVLTLEVTDTQVLITVADDGRGVALEDFAKIRARFGQADAGNGSGLGLTIAEAVAQSHKGRLEILPVERGFAVALLLPLRPHG